MGKILDALKKAEKEAIIQKKEAEQSTDGEKPAAQAEPPQAPPQQADQLPEQQVPVQQQEELKDKPVERPPQEPPARAQISSDQPQAARWMRGLRSTSRPRSAFSNWVVNQGR